MKTKVVNVGRITGLNSYELAVKRGFKGTEEEYMKKETAVYDNMKKYADDSKTEMNRLLASITTSTPDMAEVIASRGTYDSLNERLEASDDQIDTILNRLTSIDGGGDIIKDAVIDDEGYLVIKVINGYDENVYGNIELRNTGSQIQWRSTGFTTWQTLVYISDLIPKITKVDVNTVNHDEEPTGSMKSEAGVQTLTLNIPKGEDGINGGEILDAEVNDDGELILTVANKDYAVVDANNQINGLPILSIGEVKTVDYTEPASASISGTPTNPKLNLSIPRGKPTKLTNAYVGSDGFLVFNYEEVK